MAIKRKAGSFKRKFRTWKRKYVRYQPQKFRRSVKKYIKKRVKGRMLQNVSQQCYLLIDSTGKYNFTQNPAPAVLVNALNLPDATQPYDKNLLQGIVDKVIAKGLFTNGINFDQLLTGDSTFNQYSKIFRKFRIKFIKTIVTPLFCPGQDLIALTHVKDQFKNPVTGIPAPQNQAGRLQVLDYDNILESRYKRPAKTNSPVSYNINPYHSTQEAALNSVPTTNLYLRAASFTLPCVCSVVINYQCMFSEQNFGKLVN